MQSLAFPMRLEENGLLRRDERVAAILGLLQVMARTPRGSWAACPSFGLRDLFENGRVRADAGQQAMQRINQTLTEMGLDEYVATEVSREISPGRDTDTYSITLEARGREERVRTVLGYEG